MTSGYHGNKQPLLGYRKLPEFIIICVHKGNCIAHVLNLSFIVLLWDK